MIEFSTAGILKEGERNHLLRELRPVGSVRFVPEPDNSYDPNAVKIMYKDIKIGYVPKSKGGHKGSNQDLAVKARVGEVVRYAYTPDNGDSWNTEHKGILGSVRVAIEVEDEDVFSPAIGATYLRISSLLNYLNLGGGFDGIIKWAFDQGGTHQDYVRSVSDAQTNGTAMHDAIEKFLLGEDDSGEHLPDGLGHWVDKFQPETVETEVRVRDTNINVTGQYDWLGYVDYKGARHLAIVDWKSSKQVKPHHKIQASFYAKNASTDDKPTLAMVVAFGSKAKQGYSCSVVEADDIESNYQGVCLVKRGLDMLGVKYKEDECI